MTPSEDQKKLFYELAVDNIVKRTTSGKDIDGSKFTKYSKEYAKKKGVPRSSVDLVLEGDMLRSFEDSDSTGNIVKISMEEGDQTLKAYNHNVGDTLPARTFFGIKKESEMNRIVRQVKAAAITSDETEESGPSQRTAMTIAELRRAISATITTETEGL